MHLSASPTPCIQCTLKTLYVSLEVRQIRHIPMYVYLRACIILWCNVRNCSLGVCEYKHIQTKSNHNSLGGSSPPSYIMPPALRDPALMPPALMPPALRDQGNVTDTFGGSCTPMDKIHYILYPKSFCHDLHLPFIVTCVGKSKVPPIP